MRRAGAEFARDHTDPLRGEPRDIPALLVDERALAESTAGAFVHLRAGLRGLPAGSRHDTHAGELRSGVLRKRAEAEDR